MTLITEIYYFNGTIERIKTNNLLEAQIVMSYSFNRDNNVIFSKIIGNKGKTIFSFRYLSNIYFCNTTLEFEEYWRDNYEKKERE